MRGRRLARFRGRMTATAADGDRVMLGGVQSPAVGEFGMVLVGRSAVSGGQDGTSSAYRTVGRRQGSNTDRGRVDGAAGARQHGGRR